jgi:signal transduction histidine kinase
MSHEMRRPLTAILGFGELIERDGLSDDDRECVDHILSAGHRLLALVDQIVDLATLGAGQMSISAEPVRVADAIDGSIARVAVDAAARAITLRADCDPGLAVVADQRRLGQALENLVSNAVRFNHHGGKVELTAGRAIGPGGTMGTIRIEVADTGTGIPAEALARLFIPFERLDAVGSRAEGPTTGAGAGLGLALAKGLVEAMAGTIEVASEVGTGSTFRVELPAADPSGLVLSPDRE